MPLPHSLRRIVARIIRVQHGFIMVNEHLYVEHRLGTTRRGNLSLEYSTKLDTKDERQLRNRRKQARKRYPLKGLPRHTSSQGFALYNSIREARDDAGQMGFTHIRWNHRLHKASTPRHEIPPVQRPEDIEVVKHDVDSYF